MSELKDLGSSKTTLDGTEVVPIQEAAGGAGSSKHTTTQDIADLGGGGAGSPVVRAFPFQFDTTDLLTGATVYTPTVGDLILDGWFQIDTAWNGTTPKGDFGTFVGTDTGILFYFDFNGEPTAMHQADSEGTGTGLLNAHSALQKSIVTAAADDVGQRGPLLVTVANPIKVCVSQDGTNTGADPGSTQGSAVLYLVTVTPV